MALISVGSKERRQDVYRHAAAGCFGPGWCGDFFGAFFHPKAWLEIPSSWITLVVCFGKQVHNKYWVNKTISIPSLKLT